MRVRTTSSSDAPASRERPLDDREAHLRLLVRAARRVGVVRHDRRGAGDPDAVADPHGARVADALLERGSGRDELPFHVASLALVDALRQVDGWPCEHVAVGVTGASTRVAATRPAFRVGVGDEARDGGRDAGRRRGGDRRSRRAGRAAGLDVPASARACVRAAVRARAADLAPGRAARLLELRLRGRRSARRGARGDAVRGVLRARLVGHGVVSAGLAGSGAQGTLDDLLAVARELQAPAASHRRRSPRRRTVQFPGLEGVLPGFGRQDAERLGARARAPRRASRRTGRARANSPATFGHFGRSGTFLWVDPEAGIALGVPHRPGVRRLGDRGVAAPLRCGLGRGRPSDVAVQLRHLARRQELEQERVQLVGLVEADQVTGTRRRSRARRPGSPRRGGARSRGSRPCRRSPTMTSVGMSSVESGAMLGPEHLGLLVRGLQLERAPLLRTHLVAMLRCDPELQVDLGRPVEVAGVERGLLGREVVAHLLRPVPRREPGADEHEPSTPGPDARARSGARPLRRTSCRRAPPAAPRRPRSTNENGSIGSGSVPQPGRSGATTSTGRRERRDLPRQSRESPSAEWSRTTFSRLAVTTNGWASWAFRIVKMGRTAHARLSPPSDHRSMDDRGILH